MAQNLETVDWSRIPAPQDDGAADHLMGLGMPNVALEATNGSLVQLNHFVGRTVLYLYPMTGRPDRDLPAGWDMIPGARGCTPQSCAFRDHAKELSDLGVTRIFGISTQRSEEQVEAKERLHLPFELLSDSDQKLTDALLLPVLEVERMTLLARMAIILKDSQIVKVFYPVFPPDRNVHDVIEWLRANPA